MAFGHFTVQLVVSGTLAACWQLAGLCRAQSSSAGHRSPPSSGSAGAVLLTGDTARLTAGAGLPSGGQSGCWRSLADASAARVLPGEELPSSPR